MTKKNVSIKKTIFRTPDMSIEDESDVKDVIKSIFPDILIYYARDYIPGVFYHNFRKIPEHILEKLKMKSCYLVVGSARETGEGYIDVIIDNICKKHDIPLQQLIIISGSVDFKDIIKRKIKDTNLEMPKILFYNTWEKAMKRRFLRDFMINTNPNISLIELESMIKVKNVSFVNPLVKSSFKKSYLNLNYSWRPHRIAFILGLKDKQILEMGYNSFSGLPMDTSLCFKNAALLKDTYVEYHTNWQAQWDKDIQFTINHFNDPIKNMIINNTNFIDQLPLYLDKFIESGLGPGFNTTRGLIQYFKNSFFSIVTETFYSKKENGFCEEDNRECRFITEKTFRCIAYKHPFILLTLPNSLKVLHDMGYKTFHGIFDESYDDEEDDTKRMIMVLNEVERLCNLDTKTLEEYRLKLIDILEFNFNVFMNKKEFIHRIN